MQYDPNKGGMKRPVRSPEEIDELWAARARRSRPARLAEAPRKPDKRARREPNPGDPSLYDDFDTFYDTRSPRRMRRSHKRHRVGWIILFILAFAAELVLCAFVLPQVLDIPVKVIPRIAFAGGDIIVYDEEAVTETEQTRDLLTTGRIFTGVSIDGVHVGGMTIDEARAAVEAVEATGDGRFSVTVEIAGQTWVISSDPTPMALETTPMARDTETALRKAYAVGRSVSADWRTMVDAPATARLQSVNSLRNRRVVLTTSITHDDDSVRSQCEAIAASLAIAPVDATVTGFNPYTHEFTVTADSDGRRVDADELYRQVNGIITGTAHTGTVKMEPEVVHAAVTKTALTARLGLISTCTTTTTSNKNRNTNIELSAKAINGSVVLPGEMFSFNNTTGQRTAAKGYKEATAISGGATSPEIGGGVCQTSSTLFNAVACANLKIDSRSPHAWPSSYVDPGKDATVNWPSLDFRFTNDTDWPVWIVASYSDRKVTVSLYGYTLEPGVKIELVSVQTKTLTAPSGIKYELNEELPAGTRQTTVQARNGSVWETYQVWTRNGTEFKRELLCTSTYKAYQETVEYND